MNKVVDMTGKRFNRLVITSFAFSKDKKAFWNSVCDCGIEKVVMGQSVRRGLVQSCGCLHRERQKSVPLKHGHDVRNSVSPTYNSWRAMVARCTNPNNNTFQYYGAKGVVVCERWKTFENFLVDMGERPENTTLGRFGDTGNYEPTNCAWMTLGEQSEARKEKSCGTI